MNRVKLSLSAFVLCCASACSIPQREIHVAPWGDDRHAGTADRPLVTVHAAQRRLREFPRIQPVDILIHPGTYELAESLVLAVEDSGTAAAPVTWRAADPADKPVLSAGREIRGTWRESDRPSVWVIDVPGTKAEDGGWVFRQLFVDDVRKPRARFPNQDADQPFLFATGGGRDHAVIDPALIQDGWAREDDAQMNLVVHWLFFNQWNTIASVDRAAGKLYFTDAERHGKVNANPKRPNWFWIEGVLAELDQPGEWYLDRRAGRLHYMPEPGVDPNSLRFVAPRHDRVIHAMGDVDSGTHVEHLHFRDLELRHTAFTLGHIAPRVHTDAAVHFENVRHSSVTRCGFAQLGGYAFWLHLDSRHNNFDRNTVVDSGGGGVLLTGARLSYMDESKVFTPGEAAAKVAPILNRITRNTVTQCGRIRYYGGGVHLDSRPACMAMEPGNYIAHNHFQDLSRNGIFAFRNQGGNVVEFNHIHDAMQTTIDGACIHFATMNRLSAPNYILSNWLHDVWGYQQMPDGKPIRHPYTNAVFLDWDTSNTTVRDNYAFNSAGPAFKSIWNGWNVVMEENEYAETRIEPPFSAEVGPSGTATNGIELESIRLTGGVIHYSDANRVRRAGAWSKKSIQGMAGLFTFHQLQADPGAPAQIEFRLPVEVPGRYELALLYKPAPTNASNARIEIHHADGATDVTWNMQKGHKHGFAMKLGQFSLAPTKPATIVISSEGADGCVVADSVAFVRVSDAPHAPSLESR